MRSNRLAWTALVFLLLELAAAFSGEGFVRQEPLTWFMFRVVRAALFLVALEVYAHKAFVP